MTVGLRTINATSEANFKFDVARESLVRRRNTHINTSLYSIRYVKVFFILTLPLLTVLQVSWMLWEWQDRKIWRPLLGRFQGWRLQNWEETREILPTLWFRRPFLQTKTRTAHFDYNKHMDLTIRWSRNKPIPSLNKGRRNIDIRYFYNFQNTKSRKHPIFTRA